MTRDELIDLVRRIMAAEGDTEDETDAQIELFEANVPRPDAIGERRELTPAEVVDITLSYRPIALGPASPLVDPS